MPDPDVPSEALAIIEVIASAIRTELGEEIDAYPGHRQPERADPMNRAFRAAAHAVLIHITSHDISSAVVSQTLRQATERRLSSEGWDDRKVRHLIEQEPGSPDDWLTFLHLSSRPQIEPLLEADEPDPV